MTKMYVWSLFTRLYHILLVIAVGVVFVIAEFENLLSYHVAIAYTVGLLFVFRVVWGFMDVRYSKFKDFNFNIADLKEYMFNVFGKKKEYIGHNPASSWAIIAMILLAFGSIISGTIVYGVQEGMGILSFLNTPLFKDMDVFEEVHELFTTLFMLVIFVHISGVVLDRVLHKSDAIDSMINGHKSGDGKSLELTLFQKMFGVLWIASSVALLLFLLSTPSNVLMKDSNKMVDYKKEHPIFYKECISCHTLYPPYLLPRESWVKMMDDLENHFGDDASLDEEDTNSIREYLLANAAQSSTKESAYKISSSMEGNYTISITKTPYWKKRHDEIEENIFKMKEVGKISNCKACHKNIEQGLLNDKDIKIPKG